MSACENKVANPNTRISLDSFEGLKSDHFALNSFRIRAEIDSCMAKDKDSLTTDYWVRRYYLNKNAFIWIDRHGLDARADTLLSWLRGVKEIGFSLRKFRVRQIERDLARVRLLRFDSINNINVVMGRLEYDLTKGYFRYAVGQRFGFMNPKYVLNRLDPIDTTLSDDPSKIKYYQLFDIPMEHASKRFYALALRKVARDSVTEFLREIQPANPFYKNLLHLLGRERRKRERNLILCNMERCRWRLRDDPQRHQKYIVVNIPSFKLDAVDGSSDLTMRVGCGTSETKTPLLTSSIYRMDINPQWIIPKSIVKKNVARHAGQYAYFEKKRFFIEKGSQGECVDPRLVSKDMLLSPDYSVIQEGGKGNSLGRIIFRFRNNFSIYLHDTSSKDFFSKEDRGVSHGCIRVQKPFDLAVFLLDKKDSHKIEQIRYSMSADVSSLQHHFDDQSVTDQNEERNQRESSLDHKLYVHSVKVKPAVPLYIIYYTLYPARDGQLIRYNDIYGYDDVILRFLKNYQ